MHVVQLTSAHPRYDTRIFHKTCISSVANGLSVSLIVADGKSDENRNGVSILDVGESIGRLRRILNAPSRVYRKAIELNADLYQLHDPELIPIGLKLKRLGKRVVFDSHEDVPKQILSKPYLNKPLRHAAASFLSSYESWACRRLDGIIAATPYIRDKFLKINRRTIDINNYPLIGELDSHISWSSKPHEVCYVGGISKIRGILEITMAMELAKSGVRLNLCGAFDRTNVEEEVKKLRGWSRVNEYGFVDRGGVREVLQRSVAGLVTLHPMINFLDALPIKMFEYMSAGIPVVASDFPLWRKIIGEADCGLLVDPLKPDEIAKAVDHLITHRDDAQRLGANGRRAVEEHFNWQIEERKLMRFYERILNGNHD